MRKLMLIVNYYVPVEQKGLRIIEDINRGTFNFHPDNISSFNNAIGGTLIRFNDVGAIKVAMSFDAVLALYRQYEHVDNRYEDEVNAYKAENLKNVKDILRREDGETE